MSELTEKLKEISCRLSISEPARSRILLEVASDMEDLLQHHLACGMERERAVQEVADQFELSDEALRDLAQVHDSSLQRSLEGLARQAGSRWERTILALLALFLAVVVTQFLMAPEVLRDGGPVVVGMIGVLALGLAGVVWKALALFVWRRMSVARRRRGLRALPLLAGLLLFLGFGGIWVDLYRAALTMRSSPGETLVVLAHWLHMASATLVVALAGGLLLGLFWFFLEMRAAQLETAAARLLDAAG